MVALASRENLSTTGVLGLLTACPWTQSNPPDCALFEVRMLSLAERYAMVRDVKPADLQEFLASCDACPCRCHGTV